MCHLSYSMCVTFHHSMCCIIINNNSTCCPTAYVQTDVSENDASFFRGCSTPVANLYLASEPQILKAVKVPSYEGSLPSVHLRTDEVQAAILARRGSVFSSLIIFVSYS